MKSGKLIQSICFQLTIVIIFSVLGLTNLKAQQWDELPKLVAAALPNIPMMAEVNGKVYIVSGQNGTSVPTYEFDPATDTWAVKAPLPQGCFWASAVGLNGKIYVMGGGQPYPGKTYNYIYDQASDTWSKGADLLTPRMYHSACAADGKIYIMGGQNGDGTSEWYFDEYDPTTDTWQRKAPLPHNNAWYCGAVGIGKNVYRIAGGGANPTLTKDYFDVYNTETNTWISLPNFRLKLHAPVALNYDDKILVIGGTANAQSIDSAFLYDPSTETWTALTMHLPQGRTYHRGATVGSCVYVYGGQDEQLAGTLIRNCSPLASIIKEGIIGDANEMIMYPNPSEGNFSIESEKIRNNKSQIFVTNALGSAIDFDFTILGNIMNISLIDPVKGFYNVKIISGNEIENKLLIVN